MKNRNKSVTDRNGRKTRIGEFLVAPYPARECWKVEIGRRVTSDGKVKRKFFSDEPSALSWAAKQNQKFEDTGSIDPVVREGGLEDRSKCVAVSVIAYLKDKKGEVCPGQLKLMNNHLGKLVAQFGETHIDRIDPLDCREWLKDMPKLSQRTKHGVFVSCRTFYRWAMRYGRAVTSPFERMEPIAKGDAPKAILEPSEMKALLMRPLAPYVRAWLVLGGFCGLRPVEITRSTWDAIDWEAKEFHVTEEATKRDRFRNRGIKERIVEMPEAAIRLLPRGLEGKIIPVVQNTMQDQVRRLAVALAEMRGEPLRQKKRKRRGSEEMIKSADWPHDCLRHSAATYRLAEVGDAGPVAKWLGHTTTKMIYDNYARPKSKASASAWRAMDVPNNIIPFEAAA